MGVGDRSPVPLHERADDPGERRHEHGHGKNGHERDCNRRVLAQLGAERIPDAPVHGYHDGQQNDRDEQREPQGAPRFTDPSPWETQHVVCLRTEGTVRTVFVVTWSIILTGLVLYTVVGAAGL